MNPRDNLYRDLSPERAIELTHQAIGTCDDGELYLQYGVHESFAFDDGRLKVGEAAADVEQQPEPEQG